MNILNSVLKLFIGDKHKKDLAQLNKYLDKIKKEEESISSLSFDDLRFKTIEFKEKISQATFDLKNKIAELKEQTQNVDNIDEKERLYSEIEKFEKESYEVEERILEEILPQAYALIKETARRFAENNTITVTATEFDKTLALTKE